MTLVEFVADPWSLAFMQRGLVAAILVGIVCAVMGTFVVLKGMAFIGGAVAAVTTALAIGWVSRRGGLRFDTAVGVLFAGMFALGIVLFSTIDDYVGDLFSYLLGNVLGITFGDLVQMNHRGECGRNKSAGSILPLRCSCRR